MDIKKMYINGCWVESESGKTSDSINPASGEVIATITEGDIADVSKAIRAAKESFYKTREWRDMDCQDRSDMLLKIADVMEVCKDDSLVWML